MVGDFIISQFEGCSEIYSSVTEFKKSLTTECLSWATSGGWVFGTPEGNIISDGFYGGSIREKIRRVMISSMSCHRRFDLVQFWTPKEVGGRSILTTSHQPYAVCHRLYKGISLYRKKSIEHHYVVHDGANEDELGPPGRVFRNGRPESSPNVRLYSANEFPLQDYVVGCGITSYFALPVFDLNHNQCFGVLELVSCVAGACFPFDELSAICDELKVVELRTTHMITDKQQLTNVWESVYSTNHGNVMYHHQQQQSQIGKMLELASKTVPQLHFAQIMVPSEQRASSSNGFNSMKLVAFMIKDGHNDDSLREFLVACQFHNQQNGQGIGGFAFSSSTKSCFCRNISDFSISNHPTAHYAHLARLSFCFAICLWNNMHEGTTNDGLYVFEFFLQPQSRDPKHIWSVLSLLLKTMENTLTDFKVATGSQLAEKLIVDEVVRKHVSTSLRVGQNSKFPFGFEVIPYVLENMNQQQNICCSVPMEGYDENYSIFDFIEYLQGNNLGCLRIQKSVHGFLCWHMEEGELFESGGNNNSMLQLQPDPEKIKLLMSELGRHGALKNYLIQFWAHKIIKNRSYLSTLDQPFALGYLAKGFCWYRKHCMEHLYHVGNGAKEEELGPPGRVFLTGHPESSPDLRLYCTREFPLWVHVVHCDARQYLALPLFDLERKQCFGVLEVVGLSYLECISEKLKELDLTSTHINYNSSLIDDSRKLALNEIKDMFKLLDRSLYLEQAFAWMPSSQCATTNIERLCMERVCDMRMVPFHNLKFQEVNIRKGVVGRVLDSENKMCFFENIGDFSILEQPWAHYAQVSRIEFCFVICLKSSCTGNDLYILEFFISPGSNKDGYPQSYLSFLLSIMKRNLKSFKVASGQQLGEHLLFQTIGHEIDCTKNVDRNSNELNKREKSETSFRISYEDLEPHFGKTLEEAANELGVSRSTLKRARKECGIKRWPSNVKNKKNPSLFQMESSSKPVQNSDKKISKPGSRNFSITDSAVGSNVPHICIERTREVDKTCQENYVVTIKAKFKEDIIKFDMYLPVGMEKLEEEVAKRLNLLIGNIKLRYMDDDDDLILLACDEDLHHYVNSLRSLGKTTVRILVNSVFD